MIEYDRVEIYIEGKGFYENFLDDRGEENEYLEGVALTDGHYCKYYKKARNWKDKSNATNNFSENGIPDPQHYCSLHNEFMGFAMCCWTNLHCFEKGKSAGIKRVLNKIRKRREKEGLVIYER